MEWKLENTSGIGSFNRDSVNELKFLASGSSKEVFNYGSGIVRISPKSIPKEYFFQEFKYTNYLAKTFDGLFLQAATIQHNNNLTTPSYDE